jgi:hypothetical protein
MKVLTVELFFQGFSPTLRYWSSYQNPSEDDRIGISRPPIARILGPLRIRDAAEYWRSGTPKGGRLRPFLPEGTKQMIENQQDLYPG